MTWYDIQHYLEKHGPSKTSAIADELGEPAAKVSVALSYHKSQGRVTRDDDNQTWSLAANADEPGGREVEVMEESRVRRIPAKRRKERPEKSLHEATAERLENQVGWAQEALDEYLAALGDPKTKVLVDNLIAAKAAQFAFQAEE